MTTSKPSAAICPWWDRDGNRNTPEREAFLRSIARDPQSVTRDVRADVAPDVVPGLTGAALQAWIDDGLTASEQIARHRAANPILALDTGRRMTTTDTGTAERALERYIDANVSDAYDAPINHAGFVSRHRSGSRFNFHAATVATFASEAVNGSAIVKALRANRRGGFRIEDANGQVTWAAGYAWLPLDEVPGGDAIPVRSGRFARKAAA